jgi:hypothetical protein
MPNFDCANGHFCGNLSDISAATASKNEVLWRAVAPMSQARGCGDIGQIAAEMTIGAVEVGHAKERVQLCQTFSYWFAYIVGFCLKGPALSTAIRSWTEPVGRTLLG